jgi:hypothetical protein
MTVYGEGAADSFWQFHSKGGSLIRLAIHRNSAVMSIDNRFDETQAQPESSLRSAFVTPVQPFPNSWLFRWRNSDAGVLDRYDYDSLALRT